MARPMRSLPSFAVSLSLSGALHGALLALLAGGASYGRLGPSALYDVDIEAERAAPAPAPEEAPRPMTVAEHSGIAEGAPGGNPGGAPLPLGVGRGAQVGEQPAPPAAQAGRVLAVEGEGQAADFTVVQGASDRYAGGVTTSTGASAMPVRDPRARGAGVSLPHPAREGTPVTSAEPATAHAPPPPPPRASVIARPASASWSCPFPPEADTFNINHARVLLAVTLSSDGTPTHVALLRDPGAGFGNAARTCAFRQKFVPSRDADGRAMPGTTAPFHVTFGLGRPIEH